MQFGRTYELLVARPIETNYVKGTSESPLWRYQPVLPDEFDPDTFEKDIDEIVGSALNGSPSSNNASLKLSLSNRSGDDSAARTGSLRITENHITFSISKKDSGSSNKSEIRVYNLSDQSLGYLDSVSGKGVLVSLSAGYQGNNKLMVFGILESVSDVFNGVDRVTTLSVSDGGKFIRDSYFAKYYPKGTPLASIVNELILNMGLVKGVVDDTDAVIATPFNAGGSTYQALQRLSKNYGYKVSIQDLSVNFVREVPEGVGSGSDKKIAKVFSSKTGLIGFVGVNNDNSGKTNVSTDDPKNGVSFSVLLDGSIKVGTLIKLDTKKYAGVYRVTEVSHKGSFEGQDWTTTVKAEQANYK